MLAGYSASEYSEVQKVSAAAHCRWSPPLTDEEDEEEDEEEAFIKTLVQHEEVHIFYRKFGSTRPYVLMTPPLTFIQPHHHPQHSFFIK